MLGMVFGVVFAIYVIVALVNVIGVVIAAVFSGMGALFAGVFSGEGLVPGMVLGFIAYRVFRKNRIAEKTEKEEKIYG